MKISKSILMSFIAEEMQEVLLSGNIISEVSKRKTKKTRTLKLPHLAISENFGDPKSTSRTEVEKYTNRLPGNTLEEKITSINNFLESCKSEKHCDVRDPSKIITNLVILNTLTSILEDYHAGGAGHLMEAFIAALIGGRQVPVKAQKGVIDVQLGNQYYSVKFVSKFGAGGSWLNLRRTFDINNNVKEVIYYYLLKSGTAKGKKGDKRGNTIKFYKLVLTKERIEQMWREQNPDIPFAFFSEEFDEFAASNRSAGDFLISKTDLGEEVVPGGLMLGSGPMKNLANRYVGVLGESITTLFEQLDQLIENTNRLVVDGDSSAGSAAQKNLIGLQKAVTGAAEVAATHKKVP